MAVQLAEIEMGDRSARSRPENTLVLSPDELLSVLDELSPPGGKLVVSGAADQGGMALGVYILEQKVGSGAFGHVYRGFHRQLRRPVAIKVLQAHLTDAHSLSRFRREMRAQARLTHPGFACGIDAFVEEGSHCLVMDYVDGFDLHAITRRMERLETAHVVEIARQAADAMAFAHALGMIHRDLKPGNVMIDRQGAVKVMDLGLAKCEEPGEGSSIMLTREGVPIGTVDYLAPEQAGDATRVTASADVYSLGCTLYHLLCGHPPFPKGSLVERLIAHQKDAPAPVAALRPDVPQALAALIDSMLAKQPAERPASMAKFLDALSPWLVPAGEGRELLRRLVEEHGAAAGSETVGNCAEAGICDADTVCPGAAAAPQPASATDLVPVTIIGCEAPWRDRLRSRQSRRGIRRVFKDLLRGASRLGTPPRRH